EAMHNTETAIAKAQAQNASSSLAANPLYAPKQFRHSSDPISSQDLEDTQRAWMRGSLVFLVFWPALWVIWAFLTRGGYSYPIAGLALVGHDGQPAARWRCAWRAFLVWAPVTALLLLSTWLDGWYWLQWEPESPWWWLRWVARVLWWLAFGLLAAF